ncbi:DUF3987 domain-containing protein [Geminocystis sp. NIES-3708]|uniref:DUF3987 domain-containing protein n=1 Tax=Geminocystis sp. NIES-3708 TaxID=1615909 RepID=UPI00130D6F58|nr:DUF3987 domain-containing protein [Geminocystis sp. NIES-3708]
MIAGNVGSFTLFDLYSQHRFAVCKNKEYFEKGWQKGKSYDYCQEQLSIGKANGYGLLTGEFNGCGIVAIDFDGDSADQPAKGIGSWLLNQDSMRWTSGKKGHYQTAYRIPKKHLGLWSNERKADLKSYKGYNTINLDHLEIRYKGCASVIPPSVHPETDYYKWIKEIPPRELSDQESFALLNTFYKLEFNNELSNDDELKMIESAIEYIPNENYDDWITVGMALASHGDLFDIWDNWSMTSDKYKANEMMTKWQSFKGSSITLGTLFHLAKYNGFDQRIWMRENLKRNVTRIKRSYDNSDNEISENFLPKVFSEMVDRLADPIMSEDDRQLQIGQFCAQNKISSNLLQKAIDARIKANERTIELENINNDLSNLMSVPNELLNLNYLFGDYFAELIISAAAQIPTNPDAVVTGLLPVLSSVIGTRSRIIVNAKSRYIVPFILRTMIVARSGAKKSPTLRLAIDPLMDKNIDEYQRYKHELEYWQQSDSDEPKPVLRRFIVQDSTFDGLIKTHSENLNGFLCYVDELSGYFKRMNKFYNGDDIQRDLELYEGKPLIKTRASDDSNVFLERTAISTVGTIQEVMLRQILATKDDLSGVSARWLIWAGKMPLGKLVTRDDTENNFSETLRDLLNILIHQNINSDLLIDDQAYELFRQWQHSIMDSLQQISLPQLENKYSKIESDVIKFAGILHFLSMHIQPNLITNELIINSEIMARAIELGNYYLRHFAYILNKCQDDVIDSQLLKILELVEKKGEITSVDIKRYIWEFKNTPINEVNQLLLSLITLKKVDQVPTKKGIRIKSL